MKPIKCLVLKSKKVAVGFVEELERVYRIEGFYLEMEVTEQMSGAADSMRSKIVYKAFSPIGGLVTSLDIPKDRVEGFQNLPQGLEHNLQFALSAEIKNIERKRELLARPIPGRTGMTPEDWLASIAQHIERTGELPKGEYAVRDHLVTGGVFKTVPTSPYREQSES